MFESTFSDSTVMDTKAKGWIKHYLHIRNRYALQKEFERLSAIDPSTYNPEKFLYQLLQPTGIMYGRPTKLPLDNKALLRALRVDALSETDKTSIVLLEGFLHSALTSSRYAPIEEAMDLADAILEAALLIGRFLKTVYQGIDTRYRQWFFQQERRGMQLSEFVIAHKVSPPGNSDNFWANFFFSNFTFLDLLYFSKWIGAEKTEPEALNVAKEHEKMRLLIFQVIVSAALANHIVEPEEQYLFESYLQAAYFTEDTERHCRLYLKQPLTIDALDLSAISSQILKKYVFELAALMIYSDKMVTDEEQQYLDHLSRKLGLGKREAEASLLAIESFVITYWQPMELLHGSINLSRLEQQVLVKLTDVLYQHRQHVSEYLQRDQRIARLLLKAQREKLNQEEKSMVQKSLIGMIQLLPSPVLQSVPKTFFTYPLLMQVIPKDLVLDDLV